MSPVPVYPSSSATAAASFYRPSSPASSCSSCEDPSLPLNTPFSTPPTSPPTSTTSSNVRRRRKSISIVNMNPTPHSRTVDIFDVHNPSSPRRSYHSSHAVLVPASSSERGRHHSSSHYIKSSSSAVTPILKTTTITTAGATHFPRKVVSKSAVKQLHYSFSVSPDDGSISIPMALSQAQIDQLIHLTEEIRRRRRRHSSHSSSTKDSKSVSFYKKTIVHDVPPAPSPPPSEYESEDRTRNRVLLVSADSRQGYHSDRSRRSHYVSSPRYERLNPPGPSAEPSRTLLEFPAGDHSKERAFKLKVARPHGPEVVVVRE